MEMKNVQLYVRSMGKILRVAYVFKDTKRGNEAATNLMRRKRDMAVVAATDGLILLADRHDDGIKVMSE